jgi:hypothetical protein
LLGVVMLAVPPALAVTWLSTAKRIGLMLNCPPGAGGNGGFGQFGLFGCESK